MKTLEELKKVRLASHKKMNLCDVQDGIKVVVGMATCGITAGAMPVYEKFLKEVADRNLKNVVVTQVGCMGECALEPIVEIYDKKGTRTTYGNIHEADVNTIIDEHILGGNVIEKKLIANLKK